MWGEHLPLIPGYDFAGVVAGKGSNVGDSFQEGEKVYSFNLYVLCSYTEKACIHV